MDRLHWIVALVALYLPLTTAAQMYKWTDEKGKVQFSDRPQFVDDQPIQQRNTIGSNNPVPGQGQQRIDRNRLLQEYEYERNKKAEERSKKKAERAKRKKYCDQLRSQRKLYNSYSHLVEVQADGEHRYLNKDAEMAELDKKIRKHCK